MLQIIVHQLFEPYVCEGHPIRIKGMGDKMAYFRQWIKSVSDGFDYVNHAKLL